jgi:hypothetical protein
MLCDLCAGSVFINGSNVVVMCVGQYWLNMWTQQFTHISVVCFDRTKLAQEKQATRPSQLVSTSAVHSAAYTQK